MNRTISVTGNVNGGNFVNGDNNTTGNSNVYGNNNVYGSGNNIESPQVIPDYNQLLVKIDELRKDLNTKESEISSIRQILYKLQEAIEKNDKDNVTSKTEELRKCLSAFITNFAGSYLSNVLSNF